MKELLVSLVIVILILFVFVCIASVNSAVLAVPVAVVFGLALVAAIVAAGVSRFVETCRTWNRIRRYERMNDTRARERELSNTRDIPEERQQQRKQRP